MRVRAFALRAALMISLALVGIGALMCTGAMADDADVRDARRQVDEYLAKLKGPEAQVEPLTDEAVVRTFPGYVWVSVRYRQYPVAFAAPEGMKAQNLFAIPKAGKLELIQSQEALNTFFQARIATVKDDAAARTAAKAWLRLGQELVQDGFYKFTTPEDMVKVQAADGGRTVTGTSLVTGGGKGGLEIRLTFDAGGKLVRVAAEGKVMQGVRPICQATKLLDKDPIVRRMAERDILVMGRAARPYLDEQRAKAVLDLRRAIDRIWRRIVDEGW